MPILIANLSTGKGTWGHVSRLIEDRQWNKVFLITNEFGKENFTKNEKTELIIIDQNLGIKEIQEEIRSKLKSKIKDTEVWINMVSGTGKEHMALLSACLKLGLGINLIALTKDGIKEI
mgnify:CR=1 FL=1